MPKQCPSLGGYDFTRGPWPHQHRCDRWEHGFLLDHLCRCGHEWSTHPSGSPLDFPPDFSALEAELTWLRRQEVLDPKRVRR